MRRASRLCGQQALRGSTCPLHRVLLQELAVRHLHAGRRDDGALGPNEALSANHLHSDGSAILHHDLGHRSADKHGTSCSEDGRYERHRQRVAAAHRREAALFRVVFKNGGLEEVRCLVGCHAVVSELGPQDRTEHLVLHAKVLERLLPGAPDVLVRRPAHGSGHREQRLPNVRGEELLGDQQGRPHLRRAAHCPEEVPDRLLFLGELVDEILLEGLQSGAVPVHELRSGVELAVHI
mmetsp:Transcript_109527/g.305270  ORF Transcript_109527/g.305270 Transcript_109527/m.305270 type:complete len:237 (-) Transcript_109527:663-1373(-)